MVLFKMIMVKGKGISDAGLVSTKSIVKRADEALNLKKWKEYPS